MTKYQLEIRRPDGTWTPHGPPARSMTAATIMGLRLEPPRDYRVILVEDPEMMTVTCRFDTATDDTVAQED